MLLFLWLYYRMPPCNCIGRVDGRHATSQRVTGGRTSWQTLFWSRSRVLNIKATFLHDEGKDQQNWILVLKLRPNCFWPWAENHIDLICEMFPIVMYIFWRLNSLTCISCLQFVLHILYVHLQVQKLNIVIDKFRLSFNLCIKFTEWFAKWTMPSGELLTNLTYGM